MAANLKIKRVVLYKHGVGYFERAGHVEGSEPVHLDFKARDMNDVLKSMTVLDLSGGSISAVSYDSTKPLEKLLEEATIRIPEQGSLTALLGQVKGARVRAKAGVGLIEGAIVGLERAEVAQGEARTTRSFLTLLQDGALRTYDLLELSEITFLDEAVRKDLEFYLATVLSSYKKDTKRVAVFTSGEGKRELFVSYTVESPVWKTSYRVLLTDEGQPLVQGWAVVDNTGDEDWEEVDLALISGLPVSFVHDLYSPRYLKRPEVRVETESAAAPVVPEEGFADLLSEVNEEQDQELALERERGAGGAAPEMRRMRMAKKAAAPPAPALLGKAREQAMERSAPVRTIVREVGDLFEYHVDNPVTVRRNQSALVPILHQRMQGRRVLLYNRATREKNPMACLELTNSSALTLEGGPLTVTEADLYVGEAMLDTMKPGDRRLVPFAVELGCVVSVDDKTDQGPVFRAALNHGTLTTRYWNYQRTHHILRNKAKRPQTLFLEHPKRDGWDLYDTQAPAETTDHAYRFKVELAPGAEVRFTVSERTEGRQTYSLESVSGDEVKFYLSSRYIDEAVASVLRAVVKLRESAAQFEEQEEKLEEERESITEDQERIRANMKSLKGGANQKKLLDRLVTKLGQQEDRLEAMAKELEKLQAERAKLEREIKKRISELTFTADLGESSKGPR